MIPFLKVTHTDVDGIATDLTPYVLTLQISKGAEATKNSVTIELANPDDHFNETNFSVTDSSIIVYLDWEPIVSQDPIISANITGVSYLQDSNGKYKLKIKSVDKTGIFLSKIWAQSYDTSANMNASDIIINIVGHLNNLDATDSNDLTTTNVATTKYDGTAFPKPVTMAKVWKPGFEWLNELSQTSYTGEDRPYIYYVDQNNDLHWQYPFQKPSTVLGSTITFADESIVVSSTAGYPNSGSILIDDEIITYTSKNAITFQGCTRGAKHTTATSHSAGVAVSGLYLAAGKDNVYSLNIDTTDDNTYNFIIYNGGMTPAGYEYLYYVLDEAQVGKKFRMKFFDWKNVGEGLTNNEKNRTEWGTDKSASYPNPGGNPLSAGNTYTPLWTSTAVISNAEYQDSFKVQLKKLCEDKAQAYFVTGKQKYAGSAQLRGTIAYDVNDLVNCISPKFGINMLLRVKEVKHQLNKGSWITDLELESDILELTG